MHLDMNYGKWAFGLALAALIVAVAGVAFMAGRMGSDDSPESSVASSGNVETSSERETEPDVDADESYLTQVQSDYETLTKLHDEVNERVNDGSYSNGGVHWSVHHDRWAAIIDDVYTENLKVSPPTEHASFHASWIAALQGFAEASEDMKAMSEAGYAIIDGPNQADLFTILNHLSTGRQALDAVMRGRASNQPSSGTEKGETDTRTTQPTQSTTQTNRGRAMFNTEEGINTAIYRYSDPDEYEAAYSRWVSDLSNSDYDSTFDSSDKDEVTQRIAVLAVTKFGMDVSEQVKTVFERTLLEALDAWADEDALEANSQTNILVFTALYLDTINQQES